ncbi:MAG TPA: 4-vinyl reductase [Syntrophales bacterium]|jgi:hypothetical protein|nr:4-vinyl reductase [Geobacteraceae bacterium]HLA05099.1 4-vinyl reductase [Syntrophales bacterium]
MSLKLDFTLDNQTFRHYLNGHPVVMHSHHYLALITKLVEEMPDLGGTQILKDSVEESMRAIFDDYIVKNNLTSAQDKCNVGREYFSVFGLGKMIVSGNDNGGEVRLVHSHIDEGWVKKWGNHDKPINHFACGYIAAMFGAAFDKPLNTYAVTEAASIAVGDPENKFIVKIA